MKIVSSMVMLFAITGLSACSLFQGGSGGEGGSSASGGNSEYQELMAKAEAAFKAVDAVGGAWDTAGEDDNLMDMAKTAASKQDYPQAIKLAKRILTESELALKQHEKNKTAGPHLF